MQQARRAHFTAGIAMLGAGTLIAAASVAPPPRGLPDIQLPAIELTAGLDLVGGLDSVITPYIDLFTNTFTNLETIGTEFLDGTVPAWSAVVNDGIGYLGGLLDGSASIADLPGAVALRLANVVEVFTSLVTLNPDGTTLDLMLGAPLALLISGAMSVLGPVVALRDAVSAIVAGVTEGDPVAALTALLDAPATVAGGFLAGLLPELTVNIVGQDFVDLIAQLTSALAEFGFQLPTDLTNATAGGVGGLLNTLVNYVPQQIAAALTDDMPAFSVSPVFIWDLLALDLPSIFGDVTPSLAAGLPATLIPDLLAQLPALLASVFIPL